MYTGFFAAASNRAPWTFTIEVIDDDTDDPVDLTDALVEIAVRGPHAAQAQLSGSTLDGKIVIESPATDGRFAVSFSDEEMGTLEPEHYSVGIRLSVADGIPTQLFVATLPVLDGILDR